MRRVPAERTEVRRQRARKDRKRWCGGHVGREHTPETVVSHWAKAWGGKCRIVKTRLAAPYGPPTVPNYVICYHAVRCSRCGKYLQNVVDECPVLGRKPGPID